MEANEITFKFKDNTKTLDLDIVTDMDDVIQEFRDEELIPEDVTDEEASEQLVLVGVEGDMAAFFVSDSRYPKTFDFDEFTEAWEEASRDRGEKEDAVLAYMKWKGQWNKRDFRNSYQGQHKSFSEFAKDQAIEIGDIRENCPFFHHVDWESYANTELTQEYYYDEDSGCVFRNI